MARSVATRIVPLPLLIISLLAASPARSQEESYQADALLRKAAAAMGVDALSTLRYTAAGTGGGVGQP